MAQVTDIPGIKQIIQPLEESGILVKRTDEQVCLASLDIFFLSMIEFIALIAIAGTSVTLLYLTILCL